MLKVELWKVFTSLGIPGFALGVFYMLFRQFKWKLPSVPLIWRGPILVIFMLLASGLTFFALDRWAPAPDVVVVRITVLGPNKMPVDNSEIRSSVGGESKKVDGGWELEVAESKLPNDRRITIYAKQEQNRLKGQHEITLRSRINIDSIQLERETSVSVRGNVYNENKAPVEGAIVSIVGVAGSTKTDSQGFFMLSTDNDEGEEVRLKVTKEGYEPLEQYHLTGNSSSYIVIKNRS